VFDYYEPAASSPYVYRDWYSQIFSMCSIGPSVRLVNVSLPSANGVRRELGDPRLYNWHLDMQFSKFDGDTLVGNVFGHLLATRR
jgi:hypothetical protein